ncbi:mucosal addressin cell adhesion molecule 1 [Mantella aurantiaca]
MASSVIGYILLQVFLLVSANDILSIHPQNPFVPLGGSIKLNCSTNNPSCTTNWKGLDTNLGSVYTAPGYSVLTIENASVSMEGIKICTKTCPDRHKNMVNSVNLQVYALPETLHLSTSITNGIPSLHCFMKGIHPNDPTVQCYKGSERLDDYSESIIEDEDLSIFNVTRSYEISNEDLKSQTLYICEAELSVGEQTFRRLGRLEIPKVGATYTLARTVTDAENQNTVMTTSTPKTFSTNTDFTILYTRTHKTRTPTISTVFSSLGTHKQLLTSDTVLTPNTLARTMTNTENQSITMKTPITFSTSTYSTNVYTETPKERTSSPPSTAFSIFTKHKKLSTPDTVRTTNPLAVTVTNTENQATYMTTRIPTTQRTQSSPAASTELSSFTTYKVLPDSERDDINVMWMAVPAVGLAGSILIFLQIWRQLNKKGYFQPNQLHWSDCKHGAKYIHSLETGSSTSQ